MKRINNKPVDSKKHECPQCNKYRMIRPVTYAVSKEQREYKTVRGDTVKLHVDTCDACIARNRREHFDPTPADLKKLMQAIKEKSEEPVADGEKTSLEELL